MLEPTRKVANPFKWANWFLFGSISASIIAVLTFATMNPVLKMALIVVAIALPQFLLRMPRLWVTQLTIRGHYDQALRIDKFLAYTGAYGDSQAGSIFLEAGRYQEALDSLKRQAFDDAGEPLLLSTDLLYYAMTLGRKERYAEEQELLESMVSASLRPWAANLSLADCLLCQKKEAVRARELIEQVLTVLNSDKNTKPISVAVCIAMHAFALASCGLEEEAISRLGQAFADTALFTSRDVAGLQIIAGFTWRTLGKDDKAILAFQGALTLHPYGDTSLRAQKELLQTSTT